MSGARDEILARVRRATAGAPRPAIHRGYRRRGALGPEERTSLFVRRVGEYRAEVVRVAVEDVAAAAERLCGRRGARRLAVPPGLPVAWRPRGLELVEDRGLSPDELDAVDGTLGGCTLAVAETGTIVLSSAPAEGRRALSLVPDLHLCVVLESQIVELLPEALDRLEALGSAARPLTLVSGPSATSDIELRRVEGVHGPRDLVVLVAAASPGTT